MLRGSWLVVCAQATWFQDICSGDQAASSGEPEPKVLSWLHRDVELPIHACAVKVLPDRDFFQELEVLWVRAIDKWLNVFEILGYPGALGDAVFLELQQDENPNHRAMVRDSLGLKSPRTALKRAQSLLKYFQWLRSMSDVWDPWSVKACIDYMSSGNSKGPVASRGTTLLEAFRFCKFVMGIPVPDSLLNNPLVNGRPRSHAMHHLSYSGPVLAGMENYRLHQRSTS